ncbi:hypothetical protein GC197_11710 [bacterium]|nr:hypothetical protein [bacterium]
MKRILILLIMFLVASPVLARSRHHSRGRVSGYHGRGGGHASTATQAALQGMASLASAAGRYNLLTSKANINQAKANALAIQNRQKFAETYYQMRAQHDAYEADKHTPLTEEELVALAKQGIPQPLPADSYDPVTGDVHWPLLLQADEFSTNRHAIENLLKKKAANGSLGLRDNDLFVQSVDEANTTLKHQIPNVSPQKYMASYDFLNRLLFATCEVELP